MRRVCVFCESWESGGIEAFLTNVISHMDRTGQEIDIVTAQLGESVFTASLNESGIQIYQLSGRLRTPQNGRKFAKLLRERQYDVVHFNIFQGLAFHYVRIAQKAGVPIRIAHSHGAGLRDSPTVALKLKLHKLGKWLWSSCATQRLACSGQAAEFLFLKGQGYRWIPNGIEVSRFRFQNVGRERVRQELDIGADTFLVGAVGRLSEEKNHRFLLEVFRAIRKRSPKSALLLVGSGPLDSQLRKQAQSLGIEENMVFYGPSSDVAPLLWAMDLFVFPSYSEGLGIAGIEAQAAGLPVLCSEGIPAEAIITSQVRQLPLSAGPEVWAEASLETGGQDRTQGAEAVEAAGFSIQAVADKIQKIWVGDKVE